MIDDLITESLSFIKSRKIDVYTYSLYYSHEDRVFSICIDTHANSLEQLRSQNETDAEMFEAYLEDGDYEFLETCRLRMGRNVSLGDFKHRNAATAKKKTTATKDSIVQAIKTVRSRESEVAKYSTHAGNLMFSVSSLIDEFGIAWYQKTP